MLRRWQTEERHKERRRQECKQTECKPHSNAWAEGSVVIPLSLPQNYAKVFAGVLSRFSFLPSAFLTILYLGIGRFFAFLLWVCVYVYILFFCTWIHLLFVPFILSLLWSTLISGFTGTSRPSFGRWNGCVCVWSCPVIEWMRLCIRRRWSCTRRVLRGRLWICLQSWAMISHHARW